MIPLYLLSYTFFNKSIFNVSLLHKLCSLHSLYESFIEFDKHYLWTYNTYLYDIQLLNNYQALPTIISRFVNNKYLLEKG